MRSLFNRVAKNAGTLMSGNLAAAAIGAVTLATNARALGPETFGVLALVQALILVSERFFGFETWQPFTRALSGEGIRENPAGFSSAIALTVKYDLAGSLAGGLFGVGVVFLFSGLLRLDASSIPFALVYVSTLFVRFPGVPIGLLRYERRFAWQAKLQVFEALIKLGISLVLIRIDAPLGLYFLCFAAVALAHQFALWFLAGFAWKKSDRLPHSFAWGQHGPGENSSFARYSLATWVHSSSNVVRQNADVFALSLFGFGEAVGLYVIAQRAAALLSKAADAARMSIFPEISVLVGAGQGATAKAILKRSAPYAVAILIVPPTMAWLFGEQLLLLGFGKDFAPAAAPMLLLVIAQSIYLAGFSIGPLVQLLVSPTAVLRMTIPAFLISMAAMLLLVPELGLLGAGFSQVLFNVIWFLTGLWLILRAPVRVP
jgi:O-antigen/teichoic acid export membrane protein